MCGKVCCLFSGKAKFIINFKWNINSETKTWFYLQIVLSPRSKPQRNFGVQDLWIARNWTTGIMKLLYKIWICGLLLAFSPYMLKRWHARFKIFQQRRAHVFQKLFFYVKWLPKMSLDICFCIVYNRYFF